jgi:hypothetical protein
MIIDIVTATNVPVKSNEDSTGYNFPANQFQGAINVQAVQQNGASTLDQPWNIGINLAGVSFTVGLQSYQMPRSVCNQGNHDHAMQVGFDIRRQSLLTNRQLNATYNFRGSSETVGCRDESSIVIAPQEIPFSLLAWISQYSFELQVRSYLPGLLDILSYYNSECLGDSLEIDRTLKRVLDRIERVSNGPYLLIGLTIPKCEGFKGAQEPIEFNSRLRRGPARMRSANSQRLAA